MGFSSHDAMIADAEKKERFFSKYKTDETNYLAYSSSNRILVPLHGKRFINEHSHHEQRNKENGALSE